MDIRRKDRCRGRRDPFVERTDGQYASDQRTTEAGSEQHDPCRGSRDPPGTHRSVAQPRRRLSLLVGAPLATVAPARGRDLHLCVGRRSLGPARDAVTGDKPLVSAIRFLATGFAKRIDVVTTGASHPQQLRGPRNQHGPGDTMQTHGQAGIGSRLFADAEGP